MPEPLRPRDTRQRGPIRWGRRAVLVASALAGLCAIPSCYSATEIQISIDTDLTCAVVRSRGVAIYVASSTDGLHATGPVATTNECTEAPGGAHVGTLTLVPSGDHDVRIAIEVVAGVDRPTEDCFPDTRGCIVARRAPRYIDHSSIVLPVRLSTRCKDALCGPTETCNDDTGGCVPLDVCGEKGCSNAEVDASVPEGGVDATGIDAGCAPGFADCDGNGSNGCEVELATNAAHCGACGRACGNDLCTAGTCGATVVMGNVAMPGAIAVRGTDIFVTSEVTNGSLLTCKITGCATPTVLVGGMNVPNAVDVDDTHLYFSSSDKFLRRCERPACATPIMFGNDSFSSITLRAGVIFAVSEYNAYSARIAKADGGVTLLSTSNPLVMAVDSNNAFMAVDLGATSGILRCPVAGCSPYGSPPQVLRPSRDMRGIAVDTQYVYWTETDTGQVLRMSKDMQGPVTPVAEGLTRPVDLALDAGFVYWTEDGTNDDDGVVNSAPKAGGAPLVLARGQHHPHRLAVTAGRVFWTNRVPDGNVLSVRAR